jgi:hypothetical protein
MERYINEALKVMGNNQQRNDEIRAKLSGNSIDSESVFGSHEIGILTSEHESTKVNNTGRTSNDSSVSAANQSHDDAVFSFESHHNANQIPFQSYLSQDTYYSRIEPVTPLQNNIDVNTYKQTSSLDKLKDDYQTDTSTDILITAEQVRDAKLDILGYFTRNKMEKIKDAASGNKYNDVTNSCIKILLYRGFVTDQKSKTIYEERLRKADTPRKWINISDKYEVDTPDKGISALDEYKDALNNIQKLSSKGILHEAREEINRWYRDKGLDTTLSNTSNIHP